MSEKPEQWAVELVAKVIPAWWRDEGDYADQYESDEAAMLIQRAFEERTGQLVLIDEQAVERVAELQLAAFLAGRGSVTGMKHGTRTAKPAPSMDQFRQMAITALREKSSDSA